MQDTLVSKKDLRQVVTEIAHRPYSTGNIGGYPGDYRMSLWWGHGQYRNTLFRVVAAEHWKDCDQRRDQLIRQLESRWPSLRGRITSAYHIRSGIYLSLRVSNEVLTR